MRFGILKTGPRTFNLCAFQGLRKTGAPGCGNGGPCLLSHCHHKPKVHANLCRPSDSTSGLELDLGSVEKWQLHSLLSFAFLRGEIMCDG